MCELTHSHSASSPNRAVSGDFALTNLQAESLGFVLNITSNAFCLKSDGSYYCSYEAHTIADFLTHFTNYDSLL